MIWKFKEYFLRFIKSYEIRYDGKKRKEYFRILRLVIYYYYIQEL
nr:MAG TPA: hypothetical protein [Caudoviricetes sp.]